jgi:hypothetical protein
MNRGGGRDPEIELALRRANCLRRLTLEDQNASLLASVEIEEINKTQTTARYLPFLVNCFLSMAVCGETLLYFYTQFQGCLGLLLITSAGSFVLPEMIKNHYLRQKITELDNTFRPAEHKKN